MITRGEKMRQVEELAAKLIEIIEDQIDNAEEPYAKLNPLNLIREAADLYESNKLEDVCTTSLE